MFVFTMKWTPDQRDWRTTQGYDKERLKIIFWIFRLKDELNQSLELIHGLRGEVEQKENIAKIAVDNKVNSSW